jgi:hypothetical protein
MGTVATAVPQKRSFLSRFRLQHALSGLLTWYRSFRSFADRRSALSQRRKHNITQNFRRF